MKPQITKSDLDLLSRRLSVFFMKKITPEEALECTEGWVFQLPSLENTGVNVVQNFMDFSLEYMPLLINHPDPILRECVIWRMEISK